MASECHLAEKPRMENAPPWREESPAPPTDLPFQRMAARAAKVDSAQLARKITFPSVHLTSTLLLHSHRRL